MTSLSQSLASVRNELDATTARLHAMTDTLDDASWRAKPGERRWSAAECVQHLNQTSRAFVPLIEEALRQGRAEGRTRSDGSHRLGLIGYFVVRQNEPPVKHNRRVKTAAAFATPGVRPIADAVGEYESLQRRLIQLLVESEGLDIAKIKVRSPFYSRLRYSVYFAFRLIPAHQRRHLWQAEEALKHVRARAR